MKQNVRKTAPVPKGSAVFAAREPLITGNELRLLRREDAVIVESVTVYRDGTRSEGRTILRLTLDEARALQDGLGGMEL